MAQPWQILASSLQAKVHLPMSLCGGQCFRWKAVPQDDCFVGVIGTRAYALREARSVKGAVEYRQLASKPMPGKRTKDDDMDGEHLLTDYLSLDVPLPDLWDAWTRSNPMKAHPLVAYLTEGLSTSRKTSEPFADIRHLRQDIHETLFSFLCSQNNHVKRITAMIDRLCSTYGDHLGTIDACSNGQASTPQDKDGAGRKRTRAVASEAGSSLDMYTFPTITQLRKADEEKLRTMDFGYRSRFIVQCVEAIARYKSPRRPTAKRPHRRHTYSQHLGTSLATPFYRDLVELSSVAEQRAMLLTLPGVGRKVADCVLLFALGHAELVPVDTHMAQVAATYLAPPTQPPSKKRRRAASAASPPPPPGELAAEDWQSVVRQWREKAKLKPAAALGAKANAEGRGTEQVEVLAPLGERHHDAIQEGFRQLFGSHAGWAHSILFYKRMR